MSSLLLLALIVTCHCYAACVQCMIKIVVFLSLPTFDYTLPFLCLVYSSLDPFSACPSHRCYGEMLLLVAMHLQEKQLKQIEDLVTATLEMKISVRAARTCS